MWLTHKILQTHLLNTRIFCVRSTQLLCAEQG